MHLPRSPHMLLALLLTAGFTGSGLPSPVSAAPVAAPASLVSAAGTSARPLLGKTVVIDPGHQIGNSRHRAQVSRLVNAGGSRKACNSTGTQTNTGYAESAFAMSTALYLKARLEAAGARVVLTRTRESLALWGPCVDARGRVGNGVKADAVVSIHADGEPSALHGFFVIRPALRKGWTDDIYSSSARLAAAVHAALRGVGLPNADYNTGTGIDVRGDLGTLNWSNRPIVMVELGNMRNSTDAAHLASAAWRDRVYAAGLARGITAFLTTH